MSIRYDARVGIWTRDVNTLTAFVRELLISFCFTQNKKSGQLLSIVAKPFDY